MILRMTKPKKKKRPDRHKQEPFQLRLHPLLKRQLEKLADRNASNITDETRVAIRKYLEENGLWPPSEGKGS
jgi:hypothetical protein